MSSHKNKVATMKFLITFSILLFLVLESETKSRLNYQKRMELASEHYKRVADEIACGVPKPKIFRMRNSSMKLVPSATVLHRCGDQSGCCNIETYKCVPKKKEKVKLYFLVQSFPGVSRRRHRIKKFVLANHTECHCLDMSYRPR